MLLNINLTFFIQMSYVIRGDLSLVSLSNKNLQSANLHLEKYYPNAHQVDVSLPLTVSRNTYCL